MEDLDCSLLRTNDDSPLLNYLSNLILDEFGFLDIVSAISLKFVYKSHKSSTLKVHDYKL